MSNLTKTSGLLGSPASTTNKQPQSLTRKRSRKLTIPLLALLSIGMVLLTLTGPAGFAATFTTADLEGAWNVRGLSVLGNSGAWGYGTFTFNETGKLTASYTTSTGHSESPSGTFSIDEHGVIKALDFGGLTPTFHGVMSRNEGMVVSTGTGGDGSYQLHLLVKTGGTFTASDLQGTWVYHGLTSGERPVHLPGWYYGSMTMDTEGNATYSPIVDSEGNRDYVPNPAKFALSPDGLVSLPGIESFRGVMNQAKDMIVTTATMAPGQSDGVRGYNLLIMLKRSLGIYTVGDLSGTGYTHALVSASRYDDWDGWYRFKAITHAGNYTWFPGSYLNCHGDTHQLASGTMSITPDGTVTFPDTPSYHGTLSISRDVTVATMGDSGGGYGLIITVGRPAADFDLDGDVDFADFAVFANSWSE